MRWDILDEASLNWRGIGGVGCGGDWGRDRHAIMEIRGRNGKWFWAGSGRAIRKVGVIVVFKFSPRVGKYGDHRCVRGEDIDRSGQGSVNGKERAVSGELVANFFLNIEETSDMLDHLFMGESHLGASWAVRRRGGNDVRGVASAVDRRGQAR